MSKTKPLHTHHFLSRLALDEMSNPGSLDPFYILEGIFAVLKPDQLREMFAGLCQSALAEDYDWPGSPGQLLYCSEVVEQVIEACFLIEQNYKKKKISKASKPPPILPEQLPILLCAEEYRQPILVLQQFFVSSNLPQRKLALHSWTRAALSDHSVTTATEPRSVLSFMADINKLLQAAYLLLLRLKKKDSE